MKNTPEGDSNLLDQSLIVYGSGLVGRQRPHARSAADAARRPRRRVRQPGPPHHLPARDAGDESLRDDDRARRRARRARRRFDGPARRTVADVARSCPMSCRARAGAHQPRSGLSTTRRWRGRMPRWRSQRCTPSASAAQARVGAVCVTGAGLDTAIFCDLVGRFYTPGPRRGAATQVLPIGLAAVTPLPPDPPMVKPAVPAPNRRRRTDLRAEHPAGERHLAGRSRAAQRRDLQRRVRGRAVGAGDVAGPVARSGRHEGTVQAAREATRDCRGRRDSPRPGGASQSHRRVARARCSTAAARSATRSRFPGRR